jgi:hypothetical protein
LKHNHNCFVRCHSYRTSNLTLGFRFAGNETAEETGAGCNVKSKFKCIRFMKLNPNLPCRLPICSSDGSYNITTLCYYPEGHADLNDSIFYFVT